ncbi:MAG: phosphatidylserine synthase [Mesorhizobium sp.]|uniref:phospholipase D-like domain-containing protein n=2 Tax=Mesorhizobium sp. TaxID=1871066 RepID=UPI000FE76DDA|nr:phospholipase D-like domain-containing protein [Mesorhizobium sp.]RWG22561.1 MAG: phosphatidylserine synthase [Mesorhizobium sp.]
MSGIILKVFSNADDVHLVWRHENDIPGCLGFAIECRRGDAEPKYLSNRVGFEDDTEVDDQGERLTSRSSQIWPFQRYDWTDHAADLGDVIAYRVVARVLGDDGELKDGLSSDWSEPLTLSADCGDGVSVHFNRGYVLSQFMARYMKRKGITLAELKATAVVVSQQVDREVRAFLGGTLREAMLGMMGEVAGSPNLELHAALYELSDEELIDALVAVGERAHVVLANGSVDEEGEDENAGARSRLKDAGCVVHDRFLAPKALAHNKFVVVGRNEDEEFSPEAVWTGSTNWTPTGLCTQLNNGIMLVNKDLAERYEAQFKLLAESGDVVSDDLLDSNNQPKRGIPLGDATVDSWFSKLSGEIDNKELVELVKSAKQGVFFVMFQPGNEPVRTLLKMQKEKNLYVRGVATQFTSTGAEDFKLLKQDPEEFFLDAAQTSGVGKTVGQWAVEGTASQFRTHIGHAITHSKMIVIDPFGDDPIVVTGSHNFSKAASTKNDENFIVIRGHREIAMHYAINAMQTYSHYRWRAYLEEAEREDRDPFQYLSRNPKWQRRRNTGETKRMLAFWLPPA